VGEEEGNEVPGEHEAGQIIEAVCAVYVSAKDKLAQERAISPYEASRDVLLCVEVARRVKRQSRNRRSAIRVVPVTIDATDGPESPSRRVARVRNAIGRGLKEVELVLGRAVHTAGEHEKPLEE
jgi:hypothetical protein